MSERKHWNYFAALVGLGLGILLLATPTYAQQGTVQRPIEDFLSTQGTCCNNISPFYKWLPPDPNFCHWSPPQNTRFVRFAGVDYAGLAKEAYPPGRGPQFSGTVTERPLPDGRAEVTVLLHTKGANAWVVELDFDGDIFGQIANKPTLFGHRPTEVAGGAPQALGDSFLKAVFINSAPGAPLPDLLLFLWGVYFEPLPLGLEIRSVLFQAEAEGPLTAQFGVPENTPGMLHVLQNANLDATAPGKALADLWPVEMVNLKVVGR